MPWSLFWFIFCLLCGFKANAIEWGDPNGFHGTGYPFPTTMWDRPTGGDYPLDYVIPPLMDVANIAIALLAGLLLWWLFRLTCRLFQRLKR